VIELFLNANSTIIETSISPMINKPKIDSDKGNNISLISVTSELNENGTKMNEKEGHSESAKVVSE